MLAITLGRWSVTGYRIIDHSNAVISLYIPGVNQKDRVGVKLNSLDRLRGRSIIDKAAQVVAEWERRCEKENAAIAQAVGLTAQLRARVQGGYEKS